MASTPSFSGFLSGIADEAGGDIETQIRAQQELGWNHIEMRCVDGTNLTDLEDSDFERVRGLLDDSGLRVNCFASQLANWARPISGNFDIDVAELRRAIPRMRAMGTKLIRCMSYANADPAWEEPRWRGEVVTRLRALADMAADADITLVHENCDGWGGLGPRQSLELLEAVDSSHLKLVHDTGNPIERGQDPFEYYKQTRDQIVHVHIKDYVIKHDALSGGASPADGKLQATYPNEGVGEVGRILRDLFESGYDAGISIEPHIASVIHLQKDIDDPDLAYSSYVEYGRRLEKLIAEILSPSSS
jgi:sugar phosphate isomerase/epimerase